MEAPAQPQPQPEQTQQLQPSALQATAPQPQPQPQPHVPSPSLDMIEVVQSECVSRACNSGTTARATSSAEAQPPHRRSPSPAPCREPALRRRRLTGKQPAPHVLPPGCSRLATPEPCTECIGVPPSEGSRANSGEGRTVAARPDPRGVGSGRHVSVRDAWVPAAATVTNGGRPEPPLLGSRAPRPPANRASRLSSLARRTSHRGPLSPPCPLGPVAARAGSQRQASSQPDSEGDHG